MAASSYPSKKILCFLKIVTKPGPCTEIACFSYFSLEIALSSETTRFSKKMKSQKFLKFL